VTGAALSERITLQTLAAEVAELKSRVAVLERGAGPRDAADVDVIRSIREHLGATLFRPGHVFRFSRLERGVKLLESLQAADIDNPHQLGQLLTRCLKRTIDGLTVTKRGRSHYVICAISNDTPSYP